MSVEQELLPFLRREGGKDRQFVWFFLREQTGERFKTEEDGKLFLDFLDWCLTNGGNEAAREMLENFWNDIPPRVQDLVKGIARACEFDPDADRAKKAETADIMSAFSQALQQAADEGEKRIEAKRQLVETMEETDRFEQAIVDPEIRQALDGFVNSSYEIYRDGNKALLTRWLIQEYNDMPQSLRKLLWIEALRTQIMNMHRSEPPPKKKGWFG